jgi:hypothetical protein
MTGSYRLALFVGAILAFAIHDDSFAKAKKKPAAAHLSQSAALTGVQPASHVAPSELYPDYSFTPGMADTVSAAAIQARYACPSGAKAGKDGKCTYSAAHRSVSSQEKNAVYAEYEELHPGLTSYCHALDQPPAKRKALTQGKGQRCEVDHFCPVGIGCSNNMKNLWIQRADDTYQGQPMGFHQKDDLEAWGIAQVKVGKLDPAEFDRHIWADWVAYYLDVRPPHSNVSN